LHRDARAELREQLFEARRIDPQRGLGRARAGVVLVARDEIRHEEQPERQDRSLRFDVARGIVARGELHPAAHESLGFAGHRREA
jgi:hypothetical protein